MAAAEHTEANSSYAWLVSNAGLLFSPPHPYPKRPGRKKKPPLTNHKQTRNKHIRRAPPVRHPPGHDAPEDACEAEDGEGVEAELLVDAVRFGVELKGVGQLGVSR